MTLHHDEMANYIAQVLLREYRDHFGNVFISPVSSDFPKPDFIFLPVEISKRRAQAHKKVYQQVMEKEKRSYPTAFEFKTPYVQKHEYILGIGQAVTYHTTFVRSYLIVPEWSIEGFEASSFIYDVIEKSKLNIGLISYNPEKIEDVKIRKDSLVLEKEAESLVDATRGVTRSYAYWRETKPEEVFDFLKIADMESRKSKPGEDLRDKILEKLWKKVLSKRFKKAERKSSFLLNYYLLFSQLGLWDKSGRLTSLGRYTLHQAVRFGRESEEFRDIVTYLLLKYGGHYLLLRKIYLIQSSAPQKMLQSWEDWISLVHQKLQEENFYISKDDFRIDFPRLPYAYQRYFSGILLEPKFVEGKGLNINWPKILDILEKGRRIYAPIETE